MADELVLGSGGNINLYCLPDMCMVSLKIS